MESKRYSIKNAGLIILGFAVFYLVGLVYNLFLSGRISSQFGYWGEWYIRYLFIFGLGTPLFCIITKSVQPLKCEERKIFKIRPFLKYLIISFGFLSFGTMLGKVLLMIISGVPFTAPPIYFQGGSSLGAVLFLGLVPPVAEELFFRKILLQKLSNYGSGVAIIGSAAMFFLYHTNITAFEPHVFMLGFILAYVALKTNNIIYPALIHSILNIWSVWSLRISTSLPPIFLIASTLFTLSLPILLIITIIKNRKQIRPTAKIIFSNQPINL